MSCGKSVQSPGAWSFPLHHWLLTEAAGATTAADTGTSATPAPLPLEGGAGLLGHYQGGGAAPSHPNRHNRRFPRIGRPLRAPARAGHRARQPHGPGPGQ